MRLLANEYPLPDTTGWSTAAVFDLTNNGEYVTAVPYRVRVESEDGSTVGTSDGPDAVVLAPDETTTIVLDGLDPTGDQPPTQGEVTVYSRTGTGASQLIGEPDWVSSNEFLDCDTGVVGCEITGDLTFDGDGLGTLESIQVVAYQDEEIVAAGHATTEATEVLVGETVPYSGNLTSAEGFDGSGDIRFDVVVTQFTMGD